MSSTIFVKDHQSHQCRQEGCKDHEPCRTLWQCLKDMHLSPSRLVTVKLARVKTFKAARYNTCTASNHTIWQGTHATNRHRRSKVSVHKQVTKNIYTSKTKQQRLMSKVPKQAHCYLPVLIRLMHHWNLRVAIVGMLWGKHGASTGPRLAGISRQPNVWWPKAGQKNKLCTINQEAN